MMRRIIKYTCIHIRILIQIITKSNRLFLASSLKACASQKISWKFTIFKTDKRRQIHNLLDKIKKMLTRSYSAPAIVLLLFTTKWLHPFQGIIRFLCDVPLIKVEVVQKRMSRTYHKRVHESPTARLALVRCMLRTGRAYRLAWQLLHT